MIYQEYEGYWLPVGTKLHRRYRIDDVIAEGGIGIVYLGFDEVLKRPVSVKEYFPRQFAMRVPGDPAIHRYSGKSGEDYQKGLDKFIEEARNLAKFENEKNIVMVKDFFCDNETAYIVMERVIGENVRDHVEENGPMEPERVMTLMEPIMRAIIRVHAEGLLHRDISPDNIILRDENGEAVLVDFGAARLSEAQENRTMTVFFKRGYSAEEQYAEHSNRGPYTDEYGICATMYYMLTGIRPQESIRRLISDEVRPLVKFPGIDLPDYKKQAIMKGMSVSAKDRYPDVSKLCQILYEEETVIGFVRWMKGKGVRLAVAGGLAVCMILAAVTAARKIPATEDPASAGNSVVTPGAAASQLTDASSDAGVDAEPSRSPVKRVKMPDVQGIKLSKAEKKLNRMFEHVKIRIKRVYSSSTPADYVVKQSKKAGSYYRKDREFVVTLTVSRGKESTPTATPAKKTSRPVSTPVPSGTAKKGTKKNADMDDKDLAGELPW